MAKLDVSQIEHIAKLSKLEISKEDQELYSAQLSSVLDYIEQLQEVNTDNVKETANITGLSNVWRTYEIERSTIGPEEISKNAPEFKNGNFVVPGVFE